MMSTTEIALPAPPPASGSTGISAMGMGAFSGLGGYMTLGLGAKAKPAVYKVNDDGEFVVLKDGGNIAPAYPLSLALTGSFDSS